MANVTVHHGDSRDVLKTLADSSIDSIVCDPPYALVSIGKLFGKEGAAPAKAGKTGAYQRASAGFMGKSWDTGESAFAVEFWAEVLRVLKPGGHVVAFSGTRTYHRLACAIEDAGFEIRDQGAWVYGSGFPKSHDVPKAIDKHLGHERKKVRIAAPKNPPNLVGGIRNGYTAPWVEKAREAGFHEAASPEAASPEAASPEAASPEAASPEAASWEGWGTALKPA
jgi:site-specific DNA-methyltransferase (adenine-specific)